MLTIEDLRREAVETSEPGQAKPSLVNGASILSNVYPTPSFVVPDWLPVGLAMMAGRPKLGKSFLALQIARAKTAGGRLFGKEVEPGRVLLLALEDSERRLQERMLLQGWTANEAANLDVLTLDTFRSRIGPLQNGYPKLLDMVQMGNYKLVIIDTISRAFMGLRDINDSQEVTAALSPLQELAIGNDFAILGIDHHAKPKGTNPNPIDDLMGATAKSAVADTLIGVYRDPQQKSNLRLLAEGRDVEPIDLTLRFDRLTGCWQCEGETETFIQSEREREVRDALRQLGGSGTLKDICEAIDQPKSHTSSRLTALASRGMVEKISDAAGKTLLYRLIEGVE